VPAPPGTAPARLKSAAQALLEWRAVTHRAGVLALQGDFAAHSRVLTGLGLEVVLVRRPADLAGLCVLAMPGGETTTMSMLLDDAGLRQPLAELISPRGIGGGGLPVLATCAGAILLARDVARDEGSVKVRPLGLLDAVVERNAYGRQVDSFEAELAVDWAVLDGAPGSPSFHGVFIRAPLIRQPGPAVQTAARHRGEIVLVRQENILAATFHPELSGDSRLHAAVLAFGSK